jgi:hypothetical protein
MRSLPVRRCTVRVLKPHHDRLTLEYVLSVAPPGSRATFRQSIVGHWRRDDRGRQIHDLLCRLWQGGFDGHDGLAVPRPLGYADRLHLMVTEKSPGATLKQCICGPGAEWVELLDRVVAWLRRLHGTRITVPVQFTIHKEVETISGWLRDIATAAQPWVRRERQRMTMLLREVLARQLAGDLTRRCLIHGDFHPENILIRGLRVSVIDFEHGTMGDPAMDLGYFLAEIDIQTERYWSRRGRENPVDVDRLAADLLARYSVGASTRGHSMVPVYQARTYLKHLVHTIRMDGSEVPASVSRWLSKAERCLAADCTVPVLRERMARAALPLGPIRPAPAPLPAGPAI